MMTPFSLADFCEWLSHKDPNERYFWHDNSNCACGQYARDRNAEHEWIERGRRGDIISRTCKLDRIAAEATDQHGWGTFGRLLTHCKTLQDA